MVDGASSAPWDSAMKRIGLSVMVGLSLATAASAVDPNPYLELLPALRQAPAPAWVGAGTRLTYYSAVASIPGDRDVFYNDEDGNWEDGQGNKYRREDTTGFSGHGFTQVDVAALTPTESVLAVRSYGMPNPNSGLVLLGMASVIGVPGAGGDYWLDPRVLAQVQPVRRPELTVVKLPYPIDGRTYDAIRFQSESNGSRQVQVYDLRTGILLYGSAVTAGDLAGAVTQQGQPAGQKLLTMSVFKGQRQVPLPWLGQPAPPELATVMSCRYSGSHTMMIPGSPPMSIPASTALTVTERGADWIRFGQFDSVGGPGMPPSTSQSVRVAGAGQIGGIWLPPTALPQLRKGQVIDTDPISGVTTTVADNGLANQGRTFALIRENCPTFQLDYYYDHETGVLAGLQLQDRVLNLVIQMFLESVE